MLSHYTPLAAVIIKVSITLSSHHMPAWHMQIGEYMPYLFLPSFPYMQRNLCFYEWCDRLCFVIAYAHSSSGSGHSGWMCKCALLWIMLSFFHIYTKLFISAMAFKCPGPSTSTGVPLLEQYRTLHHIVTCNSLEQVALQIFHDPVLQSSLFVKRRQWWQSRHPIFFDVVHLLRM